MEHYFNYIIGSLTFLVMVGGIVFASGKINQQNRDTKKQLDNHEKMNDKELQDIKIRIHDMELFSQKVTNYLSKIDNVEKQLDKETYTLNKKIDMNESDIQKQYIYVTEVKTEIMSIKEDLKFLKNKE